MERIPLGKSSSIVRFEATDGLLLKGLMVRGKRRSAACVIVVHGMTGDFTSNVPLALARNPGNTDMFLMNSRGQGMISGFSKGKKPREKRLRIGTCLERFEESVNDIGGAIKVMSKLGYRKFILCGHSTGCQKVTYYYHRTHDRRVSGLVLAAPSDDYNLFRKRLGRKFARLQRLCAAKVSGGKGNEIVPDDSGFSAQRIDSVVNLKRVEARLFDYEGPLREFSRIRIPVLAIFGNLEEGASRPVWECLERLAHVTSSERFDAVLIDGAAHSFEGKEFELAKTINDWIG